VSIFLQTPLAFGLVLVSQGVVQTFGPYAKVAVVQPTAYDEAVTDKDGKPVLDEKGQPKTKKSTLTEQVIAVGPAASQIAIKQLGTNGGGFFNVNSAHPFENPTPLSNFVEMFAILWIPAALTYTFGKMVGSIWQGWALFAAMWILMVAGLAVTIPGEHHATPAMQAAGISAQSPNLEGKEVRIGPDESSLWAVTTTDASNGSVNSMH